MMALPNQKDGTIFSSKEYCLGLGWWLAAPLIEAPAACPGCGLNVDTTGDHFLCCRRNNFADRHDALQDALFTMLSTAVSKEVL